MEERISARPVSPSFSIRPMQLADIDQVLALAAELPTAPHWPRQAYVEALAPSAQPRRLGLVAETDRLIVGFVLVGLLPPEAELESIAVAAQAQRRGVAGSLLAAASEAARNAGAETLLLEIRASNHPAAALYRRAGFRESGRRPKYYSAPTEEAILMRLNLL